MLTKKIVVILMLLSNGCFGSRDDTVVNYSLGEDVVDAAIAQLNAYNNFSSFWLEGRDSRFFKQLALVESNYGLDITTETFNRGGIWQVQNTDFVASQHFLCDSLQSTISFPVRSLQELCTNWRLIGYADLTQPLYSLIAARSVLHYKGMASEDNQICSSVPINCEDYDDYWFQCYRNGTRGNLSDFNEIVLCQEMCDVAADVMFVLDSSGSINKAHPGNWDLVRYFTGNFTAGLLTSSSENRNRVGIITFSTSVTIHSYLTNDRETLLNDIANLPYDGGLTNTAEGLCQLLYINWGEPEEDRLRLVIVMTDGKSNEVSSECGSTLEAPHFVNARLCPEPLYYVIGVTDNVDQEELDAIATGPQYIDHLDSYQNTSTLNELMSNGLYEICFQASSFLCNGGVNKTNFGRGDRARYQIEVSEGITIRLCITSGRVVLYASTVIPTPNKALNTFSFESGLLNAECEDLFITPETLETPVIMEPEPDGKRKRQAPISSNITLFVSIEGIDDSSSFYLETEPGDTSIFSVSCSDNPCGSNTVCRTEALSYSCLCLSGYEFSNNLVDCEEVDECRRVPSVCHANASCTNTIGGYQCTCNHGFSGDGESCVIHREPLILVIVSAVCGGAAVILVLAILAAALVNICVLRRNISPTEEKALPKAFSADIKNN